LNGLYPNDPVLGHLMGDAATAYAVIALSKAGTELGELGGDIWKKIRAHLPDGVGLAVTVGPLFLLADHISNPYLAIGAAVPALKPIASVLRKAIADKLKHALTDEAKNKPKGKERGKSG